MTSHSTPGLIERIMGSIALKTIAVAQRRALHRGDVHEGCHLTAMIVYGNSGHEHLRCLLPPNFMDLTDEMKAANLRARGISSTKSA